MNREIFDITKLALANLLGVIPRISNTGDEVDPVIVQIYERNAAVLGQNDGNSDMNREMSEINDLALANLMDLMSLISNTGDEVDPIIFRIYEQNAEALNQN